MPNTREFTKLIAASFVSQTGSHFLTLALSAFVLLKTGSPVQSALVFVVSFLPSILVGAKLGHWVDRNVSRWLIARNELISIASTILCATCIQFHFPMLVLCSILAVRSILMFISRAAATKWLKVMTPPALQTERIKLFYLGFFLSTAVSGILASFVLKFSSIWLIAGVDSASYLLGIVVYLALAPLKIEAPINTSAEKMRIPGLMETLVTIFAMPTIRTSFLIVCFSQALFQGAYSALVSYLPIQIFQVGVSGVGAFQLAASIGITGGFLINWLASGALVEKKPTHPLRALGISLVAIGALLGCVTVASVSISLAFFLIVNLAYECVWLHHNSEFFRGSPKNHAARYQFTLSACAAFVMSVSTLGYSAAVERFGATTGIVVVLLAGILLVSVTGLLSAREFEAVQYGEQES